MGVEAIAGADGVAYDGSGTAAAAAATAVATRAVAANGCGVEKNPRRDSGLGEWKMMEDCCTHRGEGEEEDRGDEGDGPSGAVSVESTPAKLLRPQGLETVGCGRITDPPDETNRCTGTIILQPVVLLPPQNATPPGATERAAIIVARIANGGAPQQSLWLLGLPLIVTDDLTDGDVVVEQVLLQYQNL